MVVAGLDAGSGALTGGGRCLCFGYCGFGCQLGSVLSAIGFGLGSYWVRSG